jgi:glycosyltransferase involved in cell wall biosynthesis
MGESLVMRLLIATTSITTRGGMERIVLKIAQHFRSRVHCIHYDPEKTYPGFRDIDIVTVKGGLLARLPLERRLTASMEAGDYFYNLKLDDYDVVCAVQPPSEWVRHRNSPVLWYCNSPTRGAFDLYDMQMRKRNPLSKAVFWASVQAFKRREFEVVPQIEHIFANSLNVQKRIKKYLHRDSEVLYLGVEAEKFSCKGYEDFFFYPSRIAPEKRMEYAIEAFSMFSKGRPGWKLVIAGGLSDRPEHSAYLGKLKAMSPPGVSIELDVSDGRLAELYSRCAAVLYAPIQEDFGLVPLEGMASSKPCISVDEGGPRETVKDGVDGFLVGSPAQMAQRMAWIADHPDEREAMGRAGRKKVVRDFSWDRFLARFGEKAAELAASRRS